MTTRTSATASALVISAANKAGMDGIDRERIDAIILRESENTLYMEQQKRRDEKVNERIARMKERLDQKMNEDRGGIWKRKLEEEINPEMEEILQGRRNRSTACVMDFDMFFMACELLSKPHLKEVPCCVGGGMISTSNYKARKFGVRSGMAGWIADKLVDELSDGTQKLIHVKSNFDLYKEKSKQGMAVIRQFDPRFRAHSLDEAFIDLAPYLAFKLSKNWNHDQVSQHLVDLFGEDGEKGGEATSNSDQDFDTTLQQFPAGECLAVASETVALLRQKVCEATGGLTCSAGLAPSFTLAKIASDFNKPNGQKIVGENLEEDVWPFLRPLPTRKIPGIGRVSQKILQAFGISTVQQLYDERGLVRFLFYKQASASFLLRACLGGFGSTSFGAEEESPQEGDDEKKKAAATNLKRKGISKERTFQSGDTWSEINNRLEDIARSLGQAMEKENVFARTVSLKVKLNTFDVFQRSRTPGLALQKGEGLMSHATEMLHELRKEHKDKKFALRLLGVRCSNLMDSTEASSRSKHQECMAKFLSSQKQDAKVNPTQDKVSPYASNTQKKRPSSANSSKSSSANTPWSALPRTGNIIASVPPKPGQPNNAPKVNQKKVEEPTKEQQSMDHKGTSTHEATCPVCNKQILADSSDALNRTLNLHIDACLNAPVIREAVREETKRCYRSTSSNKVGRHEPKKRRLTDFFSK